MVSHCLKQAFKLPSQLKLLIAISHKVCVLCTNKGSLSMTVCAFEIFQKDGPIEYYTATFEYYCCLGSIHPVLLVAIMFTQFYLLLHIVIVTTLQKSTQLTPTQTKACACSTMTWKLHSKLTRIYTWQDYMSLSQNVMWRVPHYYRIHSASQTSQAVTCKAMEMQLKWETAQ